MKTPEAVTLTPPDVLPTIKIRWTPGTTGDARRAILGEFALACEEADAGDPGKRTFAYCISDASQGNLRALTAHPAVEDTAHIDRERFVIVK